MRKIKNWVNPFETNSEAKLIGFGIAFFVVGSLMAFYFNVRFDNFLHLAAVKDVEIHQPFIDNIIILSCLFVILFIFGKIINKKTRSSDILSTVLIGNAPFYLMSLSNINDLSYNSVNQILAAMEGSSMEGAGEALVFLTVVGLFSLVILAWMITLFYNGFKTASNAKGTIGVLLFIFGIILTTAITYFLPNFY